ncbi:hypothetical protein [Spirosoma endbachense]|uniref:Uncharacterized protein n=1 Tax=Spirosoma endbachense TaxID=2666025 RepID=A0A6P1VUJ6_9BACT|nr:hypothetical protein [Spirosoma endbachense]QHV96078.1 hypothetical protein GJR95_14150 [Spirosoma endbachense]
MGKNKYSEADRIQASTLEREMQQLSNDFYLKQAELKLFNVRGQLCTTYLKYNFVRFSEIYSQAYDSYSDVMMIVRMNAKFEQEIIEILAGLAIGVALGLGGGLLTATISGTAALAIGVGSEVIEASIGVASKSLTEVNGADLQPTGLHPGVIGSRLWKNLATSYDNFQKIQYFYQNVGLAFGMAERLQGQFALMKNGLSTDYTLPKLLEAKNKLIKYREKLSTYDLNNLTSDIEKTYNTARKFLLPSARKIEQDLWLFWMVSIRHNGQLDYLNRNEIKDHLDYIGVFGRNGRLNEWSRSGYELGYQYLLRLTEKAVWETAKIRESYRLINLSIN